MEKVSDRAVDARAHIQQNRQMRMPSIRLRPALLAAFLLLPLLGAIALWIFHLEFLTWAATRSLEKQGFAPVQFTIESVSLHALHARNVSLSGGAIRADEMSFSFSPVALTKGSFGHIEIKGFSITITSTKDGIRWREGDFTGGARGNASPFAGMSVDQLAIHDAHVTFNTDTTKVETIVSAELSLADGTLTGKSISAIVTATVGEKSYTADAAIEVLSLTLPNASAGQLTFAEGKLTPNTLPWNGSDISGSVNWDGKGWNATTLAKRVENKQRPALLVPFSLAVAAHSAETRSEFDLQAQTADKKIASLNAKGWYDSTHNSGSANIDIPAINFRPKGLQPAELSPAYKDALKNLTGTVSADGKIDWTGSELKPAIKLHLKDLGFDLAKVQMRSLNGDVLLNKLWPLATASGQTISATMLTSILPPAAGTLTGQLTEKFALKIQRLGIDIAGGMISTTPFTVDPRVARIETTLGVKNLDFAEMMKLLSIDGLSGTGRLDGNIPVKVSGGQIAIEAGKLVAQGPGTVLYKPGSLPPELSSADSSVDMMLRALTDFHYSGLSLDVDKSMTGEGAVFLKLQGGNPTVMPDQPFNFNIRIESNFDTLADYIALSLSSAQELLKRAAEEAGH